MICELCGRETDRARIIFIEGTKLNVCMECVRFGDPESVAKADAGPRPQIVQRLEMRERRMRGRDVYSQEEGVELVEDYPQRIRQARMSRDWNQETLAIKINEKRSVVNRLESGDMRPNDDLVAKLERTLGIKLKEKISLAKPETKQAYLKGLTLGDFIRPDR